MIPKWIMELEVPFQFQKVLLLKLIGNEKEIKKACPTALHNCFTFTLY